METSTKAAQVAVLQNKTIKNLWIENKFIYQN